MPPVKIERQTSITTYREKTPGGLSDKFTTMKKSYRMQRAVVPTKVAQCIYDESTRTTNANGRPVR